MGGNTQEYASTKFSMLEAGGAFSYGLIKDTKELIKFGPTEGTMVPVVESIPTTPPSGFHSTKTKTVGAAVMVLPCEPNKA